jgi:hypothetical protein
MQGVVAASAAVGVGGRLTASTILVGSRAQPTRGLSQEEIRVLTGVLNQFIPAGNATPPAGDLGVASFIDKAFLEAPHMRHHVLTMLAALPDADAFRRLSDADRDALLGRIERDHSESFDIVLQAVYAGYYTHPQIEAAHGWSDHEAFPSKFEPFDVSSLDAISKRRGAKA